MKPNQLNHGHARTRLAAWIAGVAAGTLLAASATNLRAGLAQPFTPGNIVVEKVGDGSAGLTSAGTPILFDEITTTGTLVQSFGIPTLGANSLVESGSAGSDGGMTLSADGKSLVFPGYNTNSGVAGVTSATAAVVPRGIGRVDAYGKYTLPVTSVLAFSGNNIRGAASDGTNNYWGSGTGSSSNYGIYYFGAANPASQVYNANIRAEGIYNGSLWYSTASSTGQSYGLAEFAGLPFTTQTPTRIIALVSSNSAYNFSVSPAGTTIYYTDDGSTTAGGGIHKWTYNGSSWSQAYLLYSNSCYGLLVDWTTTPPTLYATTGSGVSSNSVIKLQDTGASAAATVLLTTGSTNQIYRGLSFAPTNAVLTAQAPTLTGISPTNSTVSPGTNVTFTLFGATGVPVATNQWYKISGVSTSAIAGASGGSLTLTNVSTTNSASYFAVVANASGSVTSGVAVLTVVSKPTITAISPVSITTNAGSSVTFTLTSTPGTPAATNSWYKIVGTTTNLVVGATNTTLTLTDVLGGSAGGYFAILTNSSGSATSSVATLTVTGDPAITSQPSSTYGLLGGTAQFTVSVAATSPSYQWYYSDMNSNIIAPVGSSLASGSAVSGANSSTLTLSGLQASDPTNFVVVITNIYGAVTSSVASLISVSNSAILAFWNFNQPTFPNNLNDPASWFGDGLATAINCATESGATDPSDGPGFGLGTTNYSWATLTYPANNTTNSSLASNKLCGVQYSVSTLGAKNITVTYDSRVSPTASDYERLQYTTNGTTWIDYPASSTFNGNSGSGDAGFYPFSYNLTGFPGVDNNPLFAIRVVTEFQSTATYGLSANANYVGTANTYGTGGTVTYDLVTISGNSITNTAPPPVLSSFANTNTPDYLALTLNFTVTDTSTSPDLLTYSAVALDQSGTPTGAPAFGVNPGFTFGGSGVNRTLTINPNTIPDQVDAAPILVTVSDPNTGSSAAAWFVLTVTSVNLSPTNSLTALPATNLLANSSITIPFTVSDDRTPVSGLTYSVTSANNTLIPGGNIVVNGQGTANPSVTITPAANQVGVGQISVTVYDNDAQEPRSSTAVIALTVRPNTNVLALDYFNYDASGSLDLIGTNFWGHLTGTAKQLQYNGVNGSLPLLYGNGYAIVDTLDNTENLQAPLLGAPYLTNSSSVLYMSFLGNMDPAKLPNNNGSSFLLFNDGSGVTGPYSCRVIAATNGAAPGYYRFGVGNTAANATNAQMFPLDLVPGSNYTVVASVVLSNGMSTLWINPSSPASASVTDTSSVGTNLYNISDIELRESGANAGSVRVAKLKVGTTFDSVLPALRLNVAGTNAVLSSSDPTLGIQAATSVTGPYVDVSASTPYTNRLGTNSALYFRFGQ